MNMFFDTRYRATKLFSSIVGLWPYQSQFKRKIILSFSILVLISYLPPQLTRLYQVWGKDLDAVSMCIPPTLIIVFCAVKNMAIIWFDSEMRTLLREIEAGWADIALKKEENQILTDYASKTRIFCIAYAAVMYNGLIWFILMPTISPILDIVLPRNETRVRVLGFDLDYGIDMQTYWVWLWLHTSVAGVAVIFNIVGSGVIFITLTIHSCCLFEITRNKLEHITDMIRLHAMQLLEDDNHNIKYNVYQYKEVRLNLEGQASAVRECVRSHNKAIKYVQVVHYIYAWSIFVEVAVCLINLTVSLLQLVSKLFLWSEMMMSVAYILGELMHLLFLSLMAQFILDQSLNVHEAVYSSAWYNLSSKFQKDFVLILRRSSVPCQLMVGNMFVLSLETFCTILQTSMSYFTMLASFR
ncbi:odorant receptor 23a-like [Odontomachus brunneus]|uniref:odorant receptor 23a-like n=1 Tax=Odontomachus brunneus TaxID=486640 RepID=UPI0013F20994|nr:odorant receptor 23a-like [Odontomachus brunneus]